MPEDAEKTVDAQPAEQTAEEQAGPEVSVEQTAQCERLIHIEADADYLRKRYQEELAAVQSEIALPGFRRGRAPVGLVERRMGSSLKNDVISTVISESYEEALHEHDLNVVAEKEAPDLEEMQWEPGEPIEVEFKVEVLPQIEIEEEGYKGLEVEVPDLEVTEELLENEKRQFAQRFASWEPVTEGIDREDYVEATVSIADGEWSEELSFHPASEEIGPFDVEGLVGATTGAGVGDEIEVDAVVVEPDEVPDVEPDAKVRLRIRIESATRRQVPEVNDELAGKIGLESAEEIDEMIRERLEASVEEREQELAREAVVQELLSRVDFELPESLVERASLDEQRRRLIRMLRSGVPREEAEQRAAEEADETRESVLRSLKSTYLLREIADKERILVTESEVDSQVRGFASRQGWREERAREYLEERGMLRSFREDMRERRVLDFLVENATVKQVPAEQMEPQEQEDAEPAAQ